MVNRNRDFLGRALPKVGKNTPRSAQLRIVMSAIEQVTTSLLQKVTLDIAANLRKAPSEGGTPVDTGWARANWIASVGDSPREPVGTPDNISSAEGEQSASLGTVLTYTRDKGKLFITNNVPYINRLNDGHSKQAPAGFVQRAIEQALIGIR